MCVCVCFRDILIRSEVSESEIPERERLKVKLRLLSQLKFCGKSKSDLKLNYIYAIVLSLSYAVLMGGFYGSR